MVPLPLFGWIFVNTHELRPAENRLRQEMHNVSLICELDLSLDGGTYELARDVCWAATANGDCQMLFRYPAATVAFLTAEGARHYREGGLWPHINFPQGAVTGSDQRVVGKAFLESLTELGLEDFQAVVDEEGGLRYLLPILLHGGIPAHCAGEFSGLVLKDLALGADDASEVIAKWRRYSTLNTLAKPVQRFIKYGGVFVTDLVQRMIGFVEDVAVHGSEFSELLINEARIPRYLARSLLDQGTPKTGRRGRRLPRPRLLIDPDSCAGPYLSLPPVAGAAGGDWRIRGRSRTVVNVSQHDTRELPLSPYPPGWDVELNLATARRVTPFRGMEDAPVYFFDQDGRLERDQRRAQGTYVFVLAAEGTVMLGDNDTPVPQWGEFPTRAGSWQGWDLVALDLSHVKSVRIVKAVDGLDIKVPVWRVLNRPSIATLPVGNVTGPEGCDVYSEAPSVRVDDVSRGDWRVRWQETGSSEPRRSIPLTDLSRVDDACELTDFLPDKPAYAGIVEILGPLGRDFREEIAVVRGLHVKMPDRVIGVDETVEVELTADCRIGDSTSRNLTLSFPRNKDSEGTTAEGIGLRITIPRLAWAIQQRNRNQAIMGRERHEIELEEIENGTAEAVIVRCRRPADLRLELIGGHDILQDEEKQVGERGSWAFPLAPFRTTVTDAGLQRVLLRLKADSVAADVASIEVSIKVSGLRIESEVDHEENLAYVEARWEENRSFTGRVLKLWSRHRPWEPPIMESIDDTMAGFYEGLVSVSPGPYVAEIGIRDVWDPPQRPTVTDSRATLLDIGDELALESRLSGLQRSVPIEALELEIAGRGHGTLSPEMAKEVQRELGQTLVALCENLEDETLDRLTLLALSTEGLVADILNDLCWSLPEDAFLRIVVRLVPEVLNSQPTATAQQLERLWRNSPFAAAFFDSALDDASRERWERHAGWVPGASMGGPDPGGPIKRPLNTLTPQKLRHLRDSLPASGSLPLRWGGFRDAAWEMLEMGWADEHNAVNMWRSAHHQFGVYTQRMGSSQLHHLVCLTPDADMPGWCRFPSDLLAAAFHLLDPYGDTSKAQKALTDAAQLAPTLTARSLLVAIAIHLEEQQQHNGGAYV